MKTPEYYTQKKLELPSDEGALHLRAHGFSVVKILPVNITSSESSSTLGQNILQGVKYRSKQGGEGSVCVCVWGGGGGEGGVERMGH